MLATVIYSAFQGGGETTQSCGEFPRSPQSKQFPPRDGVILLVLLKSFFLLFLSSSPSPSFLLLFPPFISLLSSNSSFIFLSISFHFFFFLPLSTSFFSSLKLSPLIPPPLRLPSISRWRPGPLLCTSRLSHEKCQHHLASASNTTLFLTKERENTRIQRNHPCL